MVKPLSLPLSLSLSQDRLWVVLGQIGFVGGPGFQIGFVGGLPISFVGGLVF